MTSLRWPGLLCQTCDHARVMRLYCQFQSPWMILVAGRMAILDDRLGVQAGEEKL